MSLRQLAHECLKATLGTLSVYLLVLLLWLLFSPISEGVPQ